MKFNSIITSFLATASLAVLSHSGAVTAAPMPAPSPLLIEFQNGHVTKVLGIQVGKKPNNGTAPATPPPAPVKKDTESDSDDADTSNEKRDSKSAMAYILGSDPTVTNVVDAAHKATDPILSPMLTARSTGPLSIRGTVPGQITDATTVPVLVKRQVWIGGAMEMPRFSRSYE